MAPKERLPRPIFRYDESGTLDLVDDPGSFKHLSVSDVDVAKTFLARYSADAKTFVTYAKEIERFLLWCEYAEGLSLRDVQEPQLTEYRKFLLAPRPAEIWCTKKDARTGKPPRLARFTPDGDVNPAWRPFAAPLISTTVRKALVIVDRLFKQLAYDRYVERHPMPPARRLRNTYSFSRSVKQRYLERALIEFVLQLLTEHLNSAEDKFPWLRARYILLLFFHTGLRIEEAATHDMSAFVREDDVWFIDVTGKGQKQRRVPVTDEFLDALVEYRENIGLPRFPSPEDHTPLVPDQSLRRSITTRRIDQILQEVFHQAADAISEKNPQGAQQLRSASAHWLRHSYGTYLAREGTPIHDIQENLGHSSLQTTTVYIEPGNEERHRNTRNLSLRPRSRRTSDDG
ncbi:MAG: tyrosine-type recombinase/integrase [Sulfurifustaceae bacterium]